MAPIWILNPLPEFQKARRRSEFMVAHGDGRLVDLGLQDELLTYYARYWDGRANMAGKYRWTNWSEMAKKLSKKIAFSKYVGNDQI